MENASKALLIAGGVLLAVLTIGVLMYLWTSIGGITQEAQDAKKIEQITAFNRQYEAYQRSVLRGNDVASVINKVRDNNKKYPESPITWKFKLKEKIIDVLENKEYSENNNSDEYEQMTKDVDHFREFKNLYFECTNIKYNSQTGKVNYIEFTQRTYDEIEKLFDTVT